jgi:hypothetical protein
VSLRNVETVPRRANLPSVALAGVAHAVGPPHHFETNGRVKEIEPRAMAVAP